MVAAEDYARRFESGDLVVSVLPAPFWNALLRLCSSPFGLYRVKYSYLFAEYACLVKRFDFMTFVQLQYWFWIDTKYSIRVILEIGVFEPDIVCMNLSLPVKQFTFDCSCMILYHVLWCPIWRLLKKPALPTIYLSQDQWYIFFGVQDVSGDIVEEHGQGQSNSKVLCRMCLFGETEGSERAKKMLSCKSCGKKYHRSCLKNWSQNRGIILVSENHLYMFPQALIFSFICPIADLFHWSSWTCPSCRICEVTMKFCRSEA